MIIVRANPGDVCQSCRCVWTFSKATEIPNRKKRSVLGFLELAVAAGGLVAAALTMERLLAPADLPW